MLLWDIAGGGRGSRKIARDLLRMVRLLLTLEENWIPVPTSLGETAAIRLEIAKLRGILILDYRSGFDGRREW